MNSDILKTHLSPSLSLYHKAPTDGILRIPIFRVHDLGFVEEGKADLFRGLLQWGFAIGERVESSQL